ncbi:kinase-like domain-containing protein [Rhizophagus irregularis DAOM 181602=DAOM 197198]|nr:kinase-like domain-containing protein [Rhizophagus irregularis DAOM 181602=DAOM 197198]
MNRLCLAIWKDGPLRYEFTENKYIRKKNINIALKYISKSHNIADEVKFYNSDIFGISQNPDTNGYALVLDNVYCIKCGRKFTSYAKCSTCKIRYSWDQKINNIIQKIRFELDSYDKFEWIPYEQFYNIKEIDKSSSAYSALCKDGPYHRDININKYIRIRNVKVVLKYIDLHYIICEYNWIKNRSDRKIYGISQNKSDYILVFEGKYCEYCELPTTYSECEPCQMNYIKKNFTYCIDKNKKIGNLIREMHLKNDYSGIVFEWIPYDQFNNIKEMDECDFTSKIYSAVWKNGPSYYIGKNKYVRNLNQNKSITLKNLCDPQNNIDEILNEIKNYSDCEVYGISQDSDTKDYIMVLEAGYCDKCGLYTYGRWCKLCRINYFNKNFTVHADENEKIDYLIKKMQLKSDYDGIVFEWIPYSLFNNIEEIIKSDFTEIYSAVWKKGPSYYGNQIKYIRNKNKNKRVTFKKVYNLQDIALNEAKDYSNCKLYGISQDPIALKCLHNSQNISNKFLNEVKGYSTKKYGTGKQPFSDCAHDQYLAINICNGVRPEVNEPEIPKCYGELMKNCWDSNPDNRPKIAEILELIDLFFYSYKYDKFAFKRIVKVKKEQQHYEIEKQFKEAEKYRKSHLTPFDESKRLTTHPQAFYTSRLLNPFTKDLPKDDNIGNNSVEVIDFTNDE